MIDPALTTLIIALISFAAGLTIGHLYAKVVADNTVAELTEDIEGLLAENAHLEAELEEQRDYNARIQAELEVELAELRRGLDALGRVNLTGKFAEE